jgi:predicted HTH domain antitoxin
MATHGLSSALALYGARTLTLSQAATQAGVSEEEFVRQLNRRGIEVTAADDVAAASSDRPAHAD